MNNKIKKICRKNNLQIVKKEIIPEKKGITEVRDNRGKLFILKTEGVDEYQAKLFKIAKRNENRLCFKVPKIKKLSKDVILLEKIEGVSFNGFLDKNMDRFMDMSKKIADDYQKVVNLFLKKENPGDLLLDGKKWAMSKILLWSAPIIEAGLINYSDIKKTADELNDFIQDNGSNFFCWAHGNIIGDHIIISNDDNKPYLLDLNIVPRIGNNYYDFLRAMDFAFLKTEKEYLFYKKISFWIDRYLPNCDKREVEPVFKMRLIGILGWDLLFHKVGYTKENIENKKKILLKLIKKGI